MTAQKPSAGGARARKRFCRSAKSWVGLALVGLMLGAALAADWVAPYKANQTSTAAAGEEDLANHRRPSRRHWLGTDANDYDVLTRVIYGSRLSLLAGGVSILLAVSVGAPAGIAAGYFGGVIDAAIMRTIDIVLAFPSILIAFLVLTAFHNGWTPVILAVGLINIPIFARQVRAAIMTVRDLEYVQAARASGASSGYLMWRVLAPAAVTPVIVLATLGLGSAVIEVAGLSFLGIGGNAGDAEWGAMLNEAKDHLNTSLWPAIGPGAAISLTVLGFNLLGDSLRDALDIRLDAS